MKKKKKFDTLSSKDSGNAVLLKNMQIRKRLIISFVVLSTVPLLMLGIFSYLKSISSITIKISTYSVNMMDQVRKNIRTEAEKFENLCDQLSFNGSIQDGLSSYNQLSDMDMYDIKANKIEKVVAERFSLLANVKELQINTMEDKVLYNLGYDFLPQAEIKRLSSLTRQKKGDFAWSYTMTYKGTKCIAVVKEIKSLKGAYKSIGYIIVAIDEAYIAQLYKNIDMGKGTEIFILDRDGVLISASSSQEGIGKRYKNPELIANILEHQKDRSYSFSYKMNKDEMLVAYSFDINTGLYLVSTIPYTYLNSETREIKYGLLLIVLLSLVVAVTVSLLVTNSISAPLKKLVHGIKEVTNGNLQIKVYNAGKDEIGYLTDKFNLMVDQISELISQVRNEQRMKSEAELQMLQAQINPHFIFNTLNTLKWIADINQVSSVSEGIGALSELLRNSIVDKNELIRLKDEIKNIENYIVIQRLRYGSTFTFEYELEEGTENCLVPKLLLQPIVENSILYALEGVDSGNEIIRISSKIEQSMVIIVVSDNGRGIEAEKLQRIMNGSHKSSQKFSGIGLKNVRDRVRLNFGEEYDLEINSVVHKGTDVVIRIPLDGHGKGDVNV